MALGDTVEIYFSDETLAKFSKAPKSVKGKFPAIVFESEDFIIMDKPVGVLSHGTGKAYERNMVDDMLAYLIHTKSYNPRAEKTFVPSICNRLDRNTSGLILGAKTAAGLRAANAWLRNREVEKYYMTIVEGELKEERKVENRLTKDGEKNRVVEGDDGKDAVGIYRPIKTTGITHWWRRSSLPGAPIRFASSWHPSAIPFSGTENTATPPAASANCTTNCFTPTNWSFPKPRTSPKCPARCLRPSPRENFSASGEPPCMI